MQPCDESLREAIAALPPGPETAPERLRLARAVAKAVASVHKAGVTHFVRSPLTRSPCRSHCCLPRAVFAQCP